MDEFIEASFYVMAAKGNHHGRDTTNQPIFDHRRRSGQAPLSEQDNGV
jgi:hypothetical protein